MLVKSPFKLIVATLGALGICSSIGFAIENDPILRRFSLVGVIATDGKATQAGGIAVIKDQSSGATMTLKTGDHMPYDSNLKVRSVNRNNVELSDGTHSSVLTFLGSFPEATSTQSDSMMSGPEIAIPSSPKTSLYEGEIDSDYEPFDEYETLDLSEIE